MPIGNHDKIRLIHVRDKSVNRQGSLRLKIVIVSYNDGDLLCQRLRELCPYYDTVVVLNGTSPTKEEILTSFPQVTCITPSSNVGFASAVNLALLETPWEGTDLSLLLNPDCQIDSKTIDEILNAIGEQWNGPISAWSPQLESPDGSFQRTLWPFPGKLESFSYFFRLQRLISSRESGFVIGACLFIRTNIFYEIGSFDERFFLYSEECDWQKRAQLKGYRSTLLPSIRVTHIGGASSSDPTTRISQLIQSRYLYYEKWHGKSWANFDLIWLFFGHLIRGFFGDVPARNTHFKTSSIILNLLKKTL